MDEELEPSPRPTITREQALDQLNRTLPLETYAAIELIEHVTSGPDFFLDPPIRVASPVRTSWTVSIGIEDRYVRRDAPLTGQRNRSGDGAGPRLGGAAERGTA